MTAKQEFLVEGIISDMANLLDSELKNGKIIQTEI